MNDPIDLVYTWVNGQSLSHIILRNYFCLKEQLAPDNTWIRWSDGEQLRYSLRSVEKNAPFFRKIFIVCMDGQRPAWLVESDSISIISHSQIIPSQYLPTFCSSVIESFLHKIPDLSENFVYCNDDCIFWDRATSDVFFTPSKPKVYLNKGNSQDGAIHSSDSGHIAGIKNANSLLNSKFGHRSRREIFHFPQAFTKSACRLAWDLFSIELQQSAKSKFRSSRNIAFTNSLVPHLMLESGLAEWQDNYGIGLNIGFRSFRFMNLLVSILKFGGVSSEERALAVLKDDSKLKFIALDGDKITVKKILNKRFPTPSIFERSK